MYDYLIVGSGLFGSVFAHEAKKKGYKCLVVDKIVIDNKHVIIKPLIGLSNQMFKIEGINMLLNSQTLEGEI